MNTNSSKWVNRITKLSLTSVLCAIGAYAQPYAYVAASEGWTVSVVNTANYGVVGQISVTAPGGLAVTPDGAYVYVTSTTATTVSVISTASNSVVASINVGVPQVQLSISPNGALVYAVDQNSNLISVISTASKSLVTNIPVGSHPYGVAFSPDGTRAYVTNAWSNNVSVIDTASSTVINTFATGFGPSGVVVAPNGSLVYVANAYSNTVTAHSTASGATVATIAGMNYPSWLAITPNGSRVYAANTNGGTIGVIDANSNTLSANVSVGNSPMSVAISPDGARAYVVNNYDWALAVMDVNSNAVTTSVHGVGIYPNAVAMIPPVVTTVTPIVPAPPVSVSSAPWAIVSTHAGNFTQGQNQATYNITVTNAGTLTTAGTVFVTEAVPNGLALVSMAGSGWGCSANTCVRSDQLNGGSSFPAITVTVNAAANAPSVVTNRVSMSGGSAPLASASDATTIAATPPTVAAPLLGVIDTPADHITGVTGAIGITGWALSNIGIASVALWREPIGGEPVAANGLIFLAKTMNVPGTRPDVASAYPAYPNNTAGWGAQILTTGLPNSDGTAGTGNGTYRIHALATNSAGQNIDLGVRSMTIDNAHAVLPFGTIDIPEQGAVVSGSTYVNFGWALTPNASNVIPKDGSTIWVFIDNQPVGHPVYNNYRPDITAAFPNLQNSNGAVGYYVIDTTKLTNGLHSIAWNVSDTSGNLGSLGSRFFVVQN